jgi:hypothetical protein
MGDEEVGRVDGFELNGEVGGLQKTRPVNAEKK